MSQEKQRAIASKGGKVGHAMGRAHQWTKEEASAAGRKGGAWKRYPSGRHPKDGQR